MLLHQVEVVDIVCAICRLLMLHCMEVVDVVVCARCILLMLLHQVQVKEKDGSWTMEKPLEDWNVMRVEDDPEAPMLYYRLQGLKPTTFYQLEVTARNDIDWSLANAEFIFKSSTGRWRSNVMSWRVAGECCWSVRHS